MSLTLHVVATPAFQRRVLSVMLVSATVLTGCATPPKKPPKISYDRHVPPLPAALSVATDELSLIHI